MRKLVIFLPVLSLNMLCGIAGGSAQDASAMKATAPEKMMPKNQAAKCALVTSARWIRILKWKIAPIL